MDTREETRLVLIEAKSGKATNTIIRQLYYPYRQWLEETGKKIVTLFFQRTRNGEYHIWHFGFRDTFDYDSIQLLNSARYNTIPQRAITTLNASNLPRAVEWGRGGG